VYTWNIVREQRPQLRCIGIVQSLHIDLENRTVRFSYKTEMG